MELFGFLLIVWSASIIPFLMLLGIDLVRIWMQRQRYEKDGSTCLEQQRNMTERPPFITGVMPWLRRSSVSIWRNRRRASGTVRDAQTMEPPAY